MLPGFVPVNSVASLVAVHLAEYSAVCRKSSLSPQGLGCWFAVLLSRFSLSNGLTTLVSGFSSAVSGLSLYHLHRDEGTTPPSRKYSMSFTNVNKDLSKTFYDLTSGKLFYS